MTSVELIGYAAVAVNVGVHLMRTMIPLRILAILTNALFIAYALSAAVYPTLLLNLILLPLNIYRLIEMLLLVKRTRIAAKHSDFDLTFIRPYTVRRTFREGDTVFTKGEARTPCSSWNRDNSFFRNPQSICRTAHWWANWASSRRVDCGRNRWFARKAANFLF